MRYVLVMVNLLHSRTSHERRNGMKNDSASKNQTTRRILPIACVTALAVAFLATLPRPAHADRVTPPPVPDNLQVPAGNKVSFLGHAFGTQNYICLPSGSAFIWTLFTPQATLFDDHDRQVTTHFFSPNPDENGIVRAAWQHSRDTSAVWGRAIASSSDGNFVAPGAIPWLLIQVVGAEDGPTGGDRLTAATFIHRLNTVGGIAPSSGCALSTDVGKTAFMPYTADYFFYKDAGKKADDRN
jgi:hypothetical protein